MGRWLFFLILPVFAACQAPKADPSGPSFQRPNIVVLMADDWSWPHARSLGDKSVKTPAFDRMVREGTLFDRAFVSSPSCTPSRMAIATGQWHWRLGEAANLGGSLAKGVPTYADLLRAVGYHTGFSRKGAAPSQHVYRGTDPFGPRFKSFETFLARRKNNQPFCYWYGSGAPHRPYAFGVGKALGIQLSEIDLPPGLPDHPTVRQDVLDYYAMVERFDRESAVILARLEKEGALENTLVVMSGDNGMPFPRGKATLYDTGTRVPLVVRWGKSIKGGRRIQDFVTLCDLAPTFLEAAGVGRPHVMTGRSLMRQLRSDRSGQIDAARDHTLLGMDRHVFAQPRRAIRTSRYLYIRNDRPNTWKTGRGKGPLPKYDFTRRHWPAGAEAFSYNIDPSPSKQYMLTHPKAPAVASLWAQAFGPYPSEELYDLKKDPGQRRNLAQVAGHRSVLKHLRHRLTEALENP